MIYHMGTSIGLTVTDIDKMTTGEVIDLVYYKANSAEKAQENHDTRRKATQADYDNF